MFSAHLLLDVSKMRNTITWHDAFEEWGVFVRVGRKTWDEEGHC